MNLVHLLASPFLGGPEKQALGLARAQASTHRTIFLSFAERGLARPFLHQARSDGFDAIELTTNAPRVFSAIREVADHLRRLRANVLLTSGYKPDLIGWRAARRVGIPVVAIAHGWTATTWKVRAYEWLDAQAMAWMDAVVCVSEAMAQRVRHAGVNPYKVTVIRNALDTPAIVERDVSTPRLSGNGASQHPGSDERAPVLTSDGAIIGAIGRLSPEKGFDVLVRAAAIAVRVQPGLRFVVFGEGPMRPVLEDLIRREGLTGRFVLAGFRADLQTVLPSLTLAVSSSHTEGLPVAVMEAMAAGLCVVATAVGGTPEVVIDGVTGRLVRPNDPAVLAESLLAVLRDPRRVEWGEAGRRRVREEFTFSAMARHYEQLFDRLLYRQASGRCQRPVKEVADANR